VFSVFQGYSVLIRVFGKRKRQFVFERTVLHRGSDVVGGIRERSESLYLLVRERDLLYGECARLFGELGEFHRYFVILGGLVGDPLLHRGIGRGLASVYAPGLS